ncbi:TPA: hypothetical protein VJH99_003841 [Salmonella enterica subsp. enterica serovar 28:e,h:z6]|nr:hypothetical protein [Salmonella enterica subsp. enterica serovar 28:e,h:z6]
MKNSAPVVFLCHFYLLLAVSGNESYLYVTQPNKVDILHVLQSVEDVKQLALAGLMIVLTTDSYLVLVLCLQYSVDFSTVPLIRYFRCGESPCAEGRKPTIHC